MSYISEHVLKFQVLDGYLRSPSTIRREANGGNSILFIYPPKEESLYLNELRQRYSTSSEFHVDFIDLNQLLIDYINTFGSWEEFSDYYKQFSATPVRVFHSNDPAGDLFSSIIQRIIHAASNGKIPFLIRVGSLHGTDIRNIHIMECPQVMELSFPTVFFYPATYRESDTSISFLNAVNFSSPYRCTIIK